MTDSSIITSRKIALAPLIRKDGVHAVVWRERDGSFFTLTSASRNDLGGHATPDVILDDQSNYWSALARQAFIVDEQPRSQEMVWIGIEDGCAPRSEIEIGLTKFRGVVATADTEGVKLFVVGERGHPQVKSFARNIRRAVARLEKGV